ncbi:hypothetical protein N0Y54_32770 [Nostoc punctiforme UO1]|uniref:hypothetical protein n=1 Tax=Nostoc punctiforme TaxID=272131 RepID=UPI00309AB2C2
MEGNNLPLLELFTRLREAGLPLGIDEYQLLLEAMQAGFGITDTAALKRLCQTLWIKSAEEKWLFEHHFQQVMGSEAATQTAKLLPAPYRKLQISPKTRYLILAILGIGMSLGVGLMLNKLRSTPNPNPVSTVQPTTQPTTQKPNWMFWSFLLVIALSGGYVLFQWLARRNSEQQIDQSGSPPEVITNPTKLTQIIEDEVQVAQAVLQATSRGEGISYNRFILANEYLPVTERQMKQIWRYLRRPVREGSRTELDVEATINQIVSQGLLLEPVLVPSRVNKAELLLLIDQDGSMVPFQALSWRLAETALHGGRLGKSGVYYFHNCPIEYFYHDPYHQQAELVSDIVAHVCTKRTTVLIFSDAGAARGRYSEERYDLTKEFLEKLKKRVPYIAWLNPMPRKRWLGTTADDIASLVPMFEGSRRGVLDAIGVLRGRPTNFEGRRI